MRVYALRLVEVEGPCPWCGGISQHTDRCAFQGERGVIPPKPIEAEPELSSLELYRRNGPLQFNQ